MTKSIDITASELRDLFELHAMHVGYALAAVVSSQPKDVPALIQSLRRAMVISQDSAEGEVADAATAPFLAMIEGAEDFLSDYEQFEPPV